MEKPMCDFSLKSVQSRPAKVGDKLVTRDFGTGTRGFADTDNLRMAVCLMPGTDAFAGTVAYLPTGLFSWKSKPINHQTAIFRQVNKEKAAAHHDALEFPDGRIGHVSPRRIAPALLPPYLLAASSTARGRRD
jgi:hypothetical protein